MEDAKKLTLEGMREEHKKLLGEILLDTRDDVIGLTPEQEKINEENALAWRTQYYERSLAAIGAKLENGCTTVLWSCRGRARSC